jgi:DNA-binding response OmpR family regulator
MYNILICDDDKDIVAALEIYLTGAGYHPVAAYNGEEALKIVAEQEIHLILMDVMMPGLDGVRTTLKLRETCNVPVIMLTAKSEDNDKILGLNVGADDYVTKPFNPMEVLARVKSQLRRYTTLGGQGKQEEKDYLEVGPITLDDKTKQVTVDGDPVSLTPLEYAILKLLMSHPGQVFSTAQIYEQVWNDPLYGSDNTVAVHIRHLREKIEINPAEPRYLKVVWGLGYKLESGK